MSAPSSETGIFEIREPPVALDEVRPVELVVSVPFCVQAAVLMARVFKRARTNDGDDAEEAVVGVAGIDLVLGEKREPRNC